MQMQGKVVVIYHMFPHYRKAVIDSLSQSGRFEFWFAGNSAEYDDIRALSSAEISRFIDIKFTQVGRFIWQPKGICLASHSQFDALIFLGNPNHISTWLAAAIARLRGTKVLFWTHGWLRKEQFFKRIARNAFYRIAHRVLVYADRARELGIEAGFAPDRITVIYNSLDFDESKVRMARLGKERASPGHPLFQNERPTIICVARLTSACRFDLLIRATALLKQRGVPVNVLLVGDGPERRKLEQIAGENEVEVTFYGACYDEEKLCRLIYHAELTVSPGKVGLTAIQSLMYGTPVITHGDLDTQMPEVEAIEEGISGDFFRNGNSVDLAAVIAAWLDAPRDREKTRQACVKRIGEKWNPSTQRDLIEAALGDLLWKA